MGRKQSSATKPEPKNTFYSKSPFCNQGSWSSYMHRQSPTRWPVMHAACCDVAAYTRSEIGMNILSDNFVERGLYMYSARFAGIETRACGNNSSGDIEDPVL